MRSRYCAYTLNREEYLLATWHASTRPARLDLDSEPINWSRLKILNTEGGHPGDTEGRVEFIAFYKLNGRAQRLQENSRFVFEQGRWFYVDGQHDSTTD